MLKYKLLIVEDDHALNETLKEIFTLEGYDVQQAQHGQQALSSFADYKPDLIITDFHMPGLDGIRFAEMLQTDASTSAIPIIIITADPLLDAKLLGLKSGAVDYVFKPFLIEELVMKVRNQLRVSVSNSQNVPTMFSRIGPKANFLRALNTYLDQNFDNFQGIEEIAAGLHMSRSTFDKKVKQYSGLSSAHYLLNYKLGRAHQMLEEADLNISQIARLSGFASAAYFSTCFKNKYGVSPKKFVSTRLKILKSAHPQDCKLELESAIASLWKRFSPKYLRLSL